MRRKARLLVATMVAACLMLPVAALGTSAQYERQWTVLMYFGADNDLYQATMFCVNQTIEGLKKADADRNQVAFVVLIDGPNGGDTKVYELTKGGKIDLTEAALGSGNPERTMTSPGTLVEFINWAMSPERYPAEKTMLILKNGHAWCGICPDETSNGGNEKILMPIDDLRSALDTVYANTETDYWIDALVFDGDNMGSIEVAYELRTVTDYFVGSQQQVPLEGFPYYLFAWDLADEHTMDVDEACITMVDDYVKYYNNTQGKKNSYDKLISNSRMYVTGAVFRMGDQGCLIEAMVDSFNAYLDYMLHGVVSQEIKDEADRRDVWYENESAILGQWMYPPDAEDPDDKVWSFIPLNRNNISSSRDKALIGKMNDQQGFEWLPDVYTWLWSIPCLVNYDAYGDPDPPSGDVDLNDLPKLWELKDPYIRLLLEDFMDAFGYVEPGIYRGVWDSENLVPDRTLVHVNQSQILDRSGNSFPHGLNIWFPPSWLQWDEGDEWSDLFSKPMTYSYWGIVFAYDGDEPIYLPAEYYCIDSEEAYQDIGLDFTDEEETFWMEFFDDYYDSRWLIYGGDTGSRE